MGVVIIFVILLWSFETNSNPKNSNSNPENKTISENKTSSNRTQVTLTGTVKQVISDCAPSRLESQQHCTVIKVIVLQTNESSYALSNMNFSSDLQNKQIMVVGILTVPSKTNMTFISGDINIVKYSILEDNRVTLKN